MTSTKINGFEQNIQWIKNKVYIPVIIQFIHISRLNHFTFTCQSWRFDFYSVVKVLIATCPAPLIQHTTTYIVREQRSECCQYHSRSGMILLCSGFIQSNALWKHKNNHWLDIRYHTVLRTLADCNPRTDIAIKNKKYVSSNSESVQCNFFIFDHVTFIQFKICCCVYTNFYENRMIFRWDMAI